MLLRLKILQAGVLVEWKVSSPLSGRQQIPDRTGKNGSVALTMVLRGSLLHVTQTETSRHNSTVCTRRIPLLLHMLMCHSPMLLIFQLDRQVSSARVWEACKLWITRWTIDDEVSVITHAFWLEGSITAESSKAHTSLKLPLPPNVAIIFYIVHVWLADLQQSLGPESEHEAQFISILLQWQLSYTELLSTQELLQSREVRHGEIQTLQQKYKRGKNKNK